MKPHYYIFSIFSLQFIVIVALNAKTDVYTTLMHITRRRGFFQAKIICWILKKCAILFYIFVRSVKNIFFGEIFFSLDSDISCQKVYLQYYRLSYFQIHFFISSENKDFTKIFPHHFKTKLHYVELLYCAFKSFYKLVYCSVNLTV